MSAAALALTLAMTSKIQTAASAPTETVAVERLLERYQAKGFSDGVVLVARNGVPVFRKAFGLANREWGIPNAPDVEFWIGSITKQFTALAILQLAEAGKLSLDDPISKFLETAPPAWRGITIRHLLTHTSGIPNHTSLPEWGAQTWVERSPEDLISFIRDRPLDFAPGSSFQYDNTGYVILGLIVQRVSGQPLSDYLSGHVFEPLGMKHTGFVGDRVLSRRASGYDHEGTKWLADLWVSAIKDSGAGGIYSTVNDLLTWDQALNDPKRVGVANLKPMFTDYGHGFGFGYVLSNENGHLRWWHNGQVAGFGSIIARYPKDGLTIIVLSNDGGAPVGRFSQDLAQVYFGSSTQQH